MNEPNEMPQVGTIGYDFSGPTVQRYEIVSIDGDNATVRMLPDGDKTSAEMQAYLDGLKNEKK